MSTRAVAPGPVSWDTIDFKAMCAEAMKAAEESQNWPLLYPEEVYRQGGSMEGRVCKCLFDGPFGDKQACIGETNGIMAILRAEVVGPLSQIPNLHKRVSAKVWDPKLGEEITRVFENRMRFLAPPPDQALSLFVSAARDDVRMRTVNLLASQHKQLMGDIIKFYRGHYSVDTNKAIASVVGCRNSVADTIACWTVGCIPKHLVNGDGTYTGREMRTEGPGRVTAWQR
jgi:hypothetical protein